MEVRAIAKYMRVSPRKVRLLMREIKGKQVGEALNLLTFAPQKGAPILRKLINTAVANAGQYPDIDVDSLFNQLSQQLQITDEEIKSFIAKGKLNWKRDIPKIMNIYTRCIEPLKPLINLLRVGLELREGINSPIKDCTLFQNINILKAHTKYSSLFSCLDDQIRHGDVHTSTFIIGDKVEIRSGLTHKSKVIRTFKCNELANIVLEMRQQFYPALMIATILNDFALLDQVLISIEYKILLATLGNY